MQAQTFASLMREGAAAVAAKDEASMQAVYDKMFAHPGSKTRPAPLKSLHQALAEMIG